MSPSRKERKGCKKLELVFFMNSFSAWPSFFSVAPHLINAAPEIFHRKTTLFSDRIFLYIEKLIWDSFIEESIDIFNVHEGIYSWFSS